jgi:hypothetical protein
MDLKNKETHPSYAQLGFSRVTSNKRVPLYGTSNECREFIRLTIKRSELHRTLHRQWFMGGESLIEVDMAPSQFAEAITSLNVGDGIPVTISTLRENNKYVRVPPPPFKDERDIFDREFKEDVQNIMKNANDLVEEVKQMATEKTISKKALNVVIEKLEGIQRDINANMPFIAKSFNEFMGKAVSSAKIEFDSFVDNKIRQTGLEALQNMAPKSNLLIDEKSENQPPTKESL